MSAKLLTLHNKGHPGEPVTGELRLLQASNDVSVGYLIACEISFLEFREVLGCLSKRGFLSNYHYFSHCMCTLSILRIPSRREVKVKIGIFIAVKDLLC